MDAPRALFWMQPGCTHSRQAALRVHTAFIQAASTSARMHPGRKLDAPLHPGRIQDASRVFAQASGCTQRTYKEEGGERGEGGVDASWIMIMDGVGYDKC